jgi:hypothetical protein
VLITTLNKVEDVYNSVMNDGTEFNEFLSKQLLSKQLGFDVDI